MDEYSNRVGLQTLTDIQLIARFKRKDSSAFDVLIQRYERPIYKRAYCLTHNAEDAQDIAAVSRFRIYKHLDRIHNAITLRAWIYRIVTNAFIDSARKERRNTHASLETLCDHSNYSLAFAESKLSHCPYAQVEAGERVGILIKAINGLPKSLGLAVSLFYFRRRSYEEIAEILDIPIGTVKSRLNRVRNLLKERLSSTLP